MHMLLMASLTNVPGPILGLSIPELIADLRGAPRTVPGGNGTAAMRE
jgi:hypothetical protein